MYVNMPNHPNNHQTGLDTLSVLWCKTPPAPPLGLSIWFTVLFVRQKAAGESSQARASLALPLAVVTIALPH